MIKVSIFQFILLAIVACVLASPIDDKSSNWSSSSSNPDISTLPLKKDDSSKVNSTSNQDSGVHAHPLHKRDVNGPPKVADVSSGVNSQTSSTPSSAQTSSIYGQKNQQSGLNPSQSRVKRQFPHLATQPSSKSDTPTTPKSNSNYNPQTLYNQQRKPANVPNTQSIQPASNQQPIKPASSNPSSNPSAIRPLNQGSNQPSISQNSRVLRDAPRVVDQKSTAQVNNSNSNKQASSNPSVSPLDQSKNQPILSGNSRVKRDAPRVTDQKSSAPTQVTPNTSTNQKQGQTLTQQTPQKVQPDSSRKTRDTPKTSAPTWNQKPQDQPLTNGQKSDKPVAASQSSITNSRPARDAPNPVEQSKIVPSAHQPLKSNDDTTTSSTVTASPPLIAKVPQQKRESVQSSSSSNSQSPQFVHPVPVEQILKKPSSDSSSGS